MCACVWGYMRIIRPQGEDKSVFLGTVCIYSHDDHLTSCRTDYVENLLNSAYLKLREERTHRKKLRLVRHGETRVASSRVIYLRFSWHHQLRGILSHIVKGEGAALWARRLLVFTQEFYPSVGWSKGAWKRGRELYITLAPGEPPPTHRFLHPVTVPHEKALFLHLSLHPWNKQPLCERSPPQHTHTQSCPTSHVVDVLQTRGLGQRECVGWRNGREDQSRGAWKSSKHTSKSHLTDLCTHTQNTPHKHTSSGSAQWPEPTLWFPQQPCKKAKRRGHIAQVMWAFQQMVWTCWDPDLKWHPLLVPEV